GRGAVFRRKNSKRQAHIVSRYIPFLRLQAAVNSLDEHVGCPWARVGAVARIIVGRWAGRFDLRQRGARIDQRLNAIADDNHHIPVLQDFMLVGEVAVTRHNVGSAFAFVLVTGKAQDVIQRLDLALYTSAVLDVNERDRKSTRLNSSHVSISYAVFCLKKKKITSTMHFF